MEVDTMRNKTQGTTKARILVVEDEGIVAEEIMSRLRRLGYEISGTATTGMDALRIVAEKRPDLILMDIKLKGIMDGVETASKILALYDIPVVYLTAYADEKTLQRAKVTKPFGYLLKPFEERELHSTIEISLYNHDMEKRLQLSEERYRAISEITSDFAYAIRLEDDGSFIVEWLTDAFTRITGYPIHEKHLTRDLMNIFHPDILPTFIKRLRARKTAAPESHIYSIITKNGSIRWIHCYEHAVWDDSKNRVVKIYGGAQDITERKRAEDLLQVQKELAIALSSLMEMDKALDRILEATLMVGGIDCGALFVMDSRGAMDLVAHKGLPTPFVNISHFNTDSPQVRLVTAGKPIYGHYSDVATPSAGINEQEGLRALVIIPVHYEGRIVAALNLASHTHDTLSSTSKHAIEAISAQIGGTIARIRAEQALRRKGT